MLANKPKNLIFLKWHLLMVLVYIQDHFILVTCKMSKVYVLKYSIFQKKERNGCARSYTYVRKKSISETTLQYTLLPYCYYKVVSIELRCFWNHTSILLFLEHVRQICAILHGVLTISC